MSWDTLVNIAGCVAGGLAAYVAIRSDLASVKARTTLVEASANQAHVRIDNILMQDRRVIGRRTE